MPTLQNNRLVTCQMWHTIICQRMDQNFSEFVTKVHTKKTKGVSARINEGISLYVDTPSYPHF